MLRKPALRFPFGDNGKDLDRFARDVIEDSHLSDPETILGLAHPSKSRQNQDYEGR